ncbi:MAG: hypothetical protein RL557_1064 [archaeon]|jgi:4a-hydroxytetrahydrobiopterin dehydratase
MLKPFQSLKKFVYGLKKWDIIDGKLTKRYLFKDFKEAMKFVNQIAVIAEKMNHHPGIFISYNKVTLTIFTHEENKLTNKDFRLAKEIDRIKL